MKLNFGSNKVRKEGYLNVDVIKFPQVDVVADLNKDFIWKDNSVDVINCDDLVEHMDDPIHFLRECHRVLKVGGKLMVHIPHYKDGGAYRPQHKTVFSYTWWSCGLKENFVSLGKWKANKIWLGYKKGITTPLDYLANIYPAMWERLFWVTCIEVELEKV